VIYNGDKMSSSGTLILFVALGLFAVIGLNALNAMQGEVTSTDVNVTAATSTAQQVETPLFTAFGYVALAIICVAVLNSFRSM
jgi:hypothetical protein